MLTHSMIVSAAMNTSTSMPAAPHHGALILAAERGRGRGIAVWHRHHDEQHDAHFMHFPAPALDGVGMPEFMEQLDDRKGEPHDQEVLGRKRAIGDVFRQLAPVQAHQDRPEADHDGPQDGAVPGKERPEKRQGRGQEFFRIEQRKLDGQRTHDQLQELHAAHALLPAQHLVHVRRDFALEHVRHVQLRQHADDFFLRRRIVAQARAGHVPDFLQAAMPVHQADDLVSGGREPMHPPRGLVLQHVPELPAIMMARHLRMAAQPRLQVRYAMPGRTECLEGTHAPGHHVHSHNRAQFTRSRV